MSDPTGTAGLRRSFMAEGNRRIGRLRSLTHKMLVEHDMMAARHDPLAALMPHPGYHLQAFTRWFENTTNEHLLGIQWWQRFLERAYQSGAAAGNELLGINSPPANFIPVPAVYSELAQREFAGIAAAIVQQVARETAMSAIAGKKPLRMYQQLLTAIRKTGTGRLQTAVNTMTVQLHNAARLAEFRKAGVIKVGVEAEKLEPRKPSRFLRQWLKHDHAVHDAAEDEEEDEEVDVMTAGDDLVCIVCEEIAESGPYLISEADALIPAHPNCRCSLVPAGMFTEEQRLGEDSGDALTDENPCHVPAGSPEGGQFCPTEGAGAVVEGEKGAEKYLFGRSPEYKSGQINKHLRGGGSADDPRVREIDRDFAARGQPLGRDVYRGLTLPANHPMAQAKEGDHFHDPGYAATTPDKDWAGMGVHPKEGQTGVLLHATPDRNATPKSIHNIRENEHVLERGTTFKVNRVEQSGNTKILHGTISK